MMAAVLIVSLVLALATTAHATCAWVLWVETDETTRDLLGKRVTATNWTIVGAFSTEGTCDRAQGNKIEGLRTYHKSCEGSGGGVHVFDNVIGYNCPVTEKSGTSRVVCLPDTIDPRGPKGGAR